MDLLNRYYKESGGKGNWRMFSLGEKGWLMKYIRIWRTPLGFIICDCNNKALKREYLHKPICKTHLGFYK